MRPTVRGTGLLAAAVLLVAGCSTMPRSPAPGTNVTDPLSYLQSRQAFHLEGRVAGAVGNEGFNAQLELQQRGEESRVVLRSPLGFGSATVTTDGKRLEYRSSRGETLNGDEGVAALAARLGFEPPIRSLRYWLLGVPDPSTATEPAATQAGGAVPTFEQLGWRVTVGESKPASTPDGIVSLPRRVTLERAPVRLRVVVDQWKLDR